MIVLFIKRLFCSLSLCALIAVSASGAATDYTTGTMDGAGKVTIEPETGDRKVEVTAPPPAAHDQHSIPVYVYPQVGAPGPYPPGPYPPYPKPAPPKGR